LPENKRPAPNEVIAKNYTRILNIGCSVGYYAVGLTLRMPHVIVEAFDIDPSISKTICDRFVPSHAVELIRNRNYLPDVSSFVSPEQNLSPFDQLLLGWEGRDGATPWGVFWSKS
jgi:hypothetical protein